MSHDRINHGRTREVRIKTSDAHFNETTCCHHSWRYPPPSPAANRDNTGHEQHAGREETTVKGVFLRRTSKRHRTHPSPPTLPPRRNVAQKRGCPRGSPGIRRRGPFLAKNICQGQPFDTTGVLDKEPIALTDGHRARV